MIYRTIILSTTFLLTGFCVFSQVAMFDSGLVDLDSGRYEEAIKKFTYCIDEGYKVETAFFNRSVAYSNLEQYEQAIADIKASIEHFPEAYRSLSSPSGRVLVQKPQIH